MSTGLNSRTGPSVAQALAHGRRLLAEAPALAASQAREILASAPGHPEAYRLLGTALRRTGDPGGANDAELAAIAASVRDPELLRAGRALVENDLPTAERMLRPLLHRRPADVAAIRMMAELAARVGRPGDAENLLRRALELAPGWEAARANLATLLYRQNRWAEALAELEAIATAEDDSRRSLKAAVLGRVGAYEEAIALYRAVLERQPGQPKVWMSLGHMLKTVGRTDEAVAAYRQALGIAPTLGEIWWSLANLKTVRFSDEDVAAMRKDEDVAAMRKVLEAEDLGDEDRLHLHFALGKALEDRREDEQAFSHYAKANCIRAAQLRYDPQRMTEHVDTSTRLFTREFLEQRSDQGCAAPDPIFILGMPRAGSTLVEQILASHSQVEGTQELPDMIALVKELSARGSYPELLAELAPQELAELGQDYLERTRIHRSSGRAFFIDKMPNKLGSCRADPPDPPKRADHRCAPPPARLLLFELQAALCARPGLFLRPGEPRPLLPRLCAADGPFRRGRARRRPPRDPRAAGRRPGKRNPPAARTSRSPVR